MTLETYSITVTIGAAIASMTAFRMWQVAEGEKRKHAKTKKANGEYYSKVQQLRAEVQEQDVVLGVQNALIDGLKKDAETRKKKIKTLDKLASKPDRPKLKKDPEKIAAILCLTTTKRGKAWMKERKLYARNIAKAQQVNESTISEIKNGDSYAGHRAMQSPDRAGEVLGVG